MTDGTREPVEDRRHHVRSLLMRESLLDKGVMSSTETPVVRMLPDAHVIKVGGRSILDGGKATTYPLVEAIGEQLGEKKLIIGVGGGVRSRHTFSIGIDLGLPTGVLAQLALADALGNAHMLGTLLSPYGVVAPPPEVFGHLLPLIIQAVPGVIFNGDPPYSLWERPAGVGRIPPHRSDAGAYLLAECFGVATMTLIKDVDGLYTADPARAGAAAERYEEVSWRTAREVGGCIVQPKAVGFAESERLEFEVAAPGATVATRVGPGPDRLTARAAEVCA